MLRKTLFRGAEESVGVPVVIDVFRAFTCCAILIHKRVRELRLVADPEHALRVKRDSGCLAMGEEGGIIYPGFDFPNSPSVLLSTPDNVFRDKSVVCSTSAGTKGVVSACKSCGQAILGSYVTAAAIAAFLRRNAFGAPITLVSIGAEGVAPAAEDEECANYLESLLTGKDYDNLGSLLRILRSERHQKTLRNQRSHFPVEDMIIALQRDMFPFVLIGRGSGAPIAVESASVPSSEHMSADNGEIVR